uniref:Uncharacterized protein n=1 Tax=Glossina austeni TaxID=7395 RepID=A0A1A9UEV6_GLOAU
MQHDHRIEFPQLPDNFGSACPHTTRREPITNTMLEVYHKSWGGESVLDKFVKMLTLIAINLCTHSPTKSNGPIGGDKEVYFHFIVSSNMDNGKVRQLIKSETISISNPHLKEQGESAESDNRN